MKKLYLLSVLIIFLCNNEKVFSQGCISHSRSANEQTKEELQLSCGNAYLDNYCYSEFRNISWMLQINSSLFFFDDCPIDSYYNSGTNKLVLGKNMINTIVANYGLNPDESGFLYGTVLPFLIAHEAGHTKAKKMGWDFKTGLTVKKNELFADFCAGMYTVLQRTIINSNSGTRFYGAFNIDQILDFFKSLGDWEFNNPQHHGTPEDRKIAIIAGYNFMSDYIFNYQRNNNTNAIPLVNNVDLFQAVSKTLANFSD